jgi:sulfofructose kinase
MKTSVSPQVDVVGVGLNATDTIIRLPHFPAFNSKMEFEAARILPGGQVASAMVACRCWGLRARYIGKVGDDFAADLQQRELDRAGVESHLLRVTDCASQCAYILVDSGSGERTILWRRDARLTLTPEELDRHLITHARALLVDGHDTAAAATAARWARGAGIPVAADVDNLYPGIEPLLEQVDYLVASEEFPGRLTGEPDLLRSLPVIAERYGCRVAGATLGSSGALLWDCSSSAFLYQPAYRLQVADTTGAGDIFHGAFVYALLQAWPLPRILDFSCAAAGLNCTALGARGGIRSVAEIQRLMHHGSHLEPHPAFVQFHRGAAAR